MGSKSGRNNGKVALLLSSSGTDNCGQVALIILGFIYGKILKAGRELIRSSMKTSRRQFISDYPRRYSVD